MDQPNVWQQLGLPANFAPTPIGWAFSKVSAADPAGARTVHVLILETVTGRLAFVFDPESFRRLAEQIIEQTSGLQIASGLPTNGKTAASP